MQGKQQSKSLLSVSALHAFQKLRKLVALARGDGDFAVVKQHRRAAVFLAKTLHESHIDKAVMMHTKEAIGRKPFLKFRKRLGSQQTAFASLPQLSALNRPNPKIAPPTFSPGSASCRTISVSFSKPHLSLKGQSNTSWRCSRRKIILFRKWGRSYDRCLHTVYYFQ